MKSKLKGGFSRSTAAAVLLSLIPIFSFCVACSGIQGTYADVSHSVILELKSGGKATFTAMGDSASCTYAASGKKLTLNCGGDAGTNVFTIMDDGSLAGPPGTFIPTLLKQK
ncbi:MAG: hypothetical protein WBD46_10145 [Acidobacteriaceae bacterium]